MSVKLAMQQRLCRALDDALNEAGYGIPPYFMEPPRHKAHGDFCTNAALLLAKPAMLPARHIAHDLSRRLALHPLIQRTEVAGGGFLNVYLPQGWLAQIAVEIASNPTAYGMTTAHVPPPKSTLPLAQDGDACRFLQYLQDAGVAFDHDACTKHSNQNPVFYVQYAHGRMCALVRMLEAQGFVRGDDLSPLTAEEELSLLSALDDLPHITAACARTGNFAPVAAYAMAVAAAFHAFYQACPLTNQPAALTNARLTLIHCTRIVLGNSLKQLGLHAPHVL